MKKTITTISMAIMLTMGATFANAGIIIGDKPSTDPCSKDGIIIGDGPGIIIGDSPVLNGIIIALDGIIIGDKPAPVPCVAKDGIIIGD